MREHEARLEELALSAQSLPEGSLERQLVLAELIQTIQTPGLLGRPRRGQFKGFYDDIYIDALQRLFLHICEHVEEFNPKRGSVLQWANFLLNKRFFIAASQDYLPITPPGVDPRSVIRLSIDDLDQHQQADGGTLATATKGQDIRDLLSSDPQGLFCRTYILHHPEANFQQIAMRRLNGFSWQEISTEFEISIPTLSSFYQRSLEKLGPILRDHLSP